MSRILLLFLSLLMYLTSQATTPPERVLPLNQAVFPLAYYVEQAKEWATITQQEDAPTIA